MSIFLIENANAAGEQWVAWMIGAFVDSAALLLVVGLLWLAIRKIVAPQVGYCLFLLVPLKLLCPLQLTVPPAVAVWTPSTIVSSFFQADPIAENVGSPGETGRVAIGPATARDPSKSPFPADNSGRVDPPSQPAFSSLTGPSGGGTVAGGASRGTATAPTLVAMTTGQQRQTLRPSAIVLGIWLAGVLLLAVRFAGGQLRFRMRLKTASPVDRSRFPVDLSELCRRAGVAATVRLVESDQAPVPAVWGFVRPTIVLPRGIASSLTARQIEWVLLHELAHVRRRDLAMIVLQRFAAILHFFNPALAVANRIAYRLREYACDDFAISLSAGPRTELGDAFVQILRNAARAQRPLDGGLGFFGLDAQASCVQRVRRVLDSRRPIKASAGWLSLCAVSLVAVVALPRLRAAGDVANAGAPTAARDEGNARTSNVGVAKGAAPRSNATVEPVRGLRTFDLRIVGPDEKAIPNADIELRGRPVIKQGQVLHGQFLRGRSYDALVKSDAGGRLVLEIPEKLKRFDVSLQVPGYAPYWAGWDPDVNSEPIPAAFTAKLEGGWSMGGVVVDDAGNPVTGARISPRIEFTKRPGELRQLGVGAEQRTDALGKWSYDCVPASQHEVFVEIGHPDFMPERRPLTRAEFAIERGRPPIAKIVLQRGLSVGGKVIDETGRPIVGALVRTKFLNDIRKAVTGPDGAYRLIGCEPRVARIVVSAPGRATDMQETRVEAGMPPVDFRMKPGGTVRIRVVDGRGNPIPRTRIFFQWWRGRFQDFEFDHVNQFADNQGVWEWKAAPLDEFKADICPPDGMQLGSQSLIARKEEYVFRPPPPLVVSGFVVDAETKQPVIKFRVVPGIRSSAAHMNWDRSDSFISLGGRYQIRDRYGYYGHLVRIEADGYRPAVSRTIKSDEGNVSIDFELTRAKDFDATVLTPDGRPAAQAKVAIGIAGSQINFKNGDIDDSSTFAERHETDDAGHLHFPPQDGPFWLVITHPSGFVLFKPTPESNRRIINLDPWSRVEGTFRVAGRPQANVKIWLSTNPIGNNLFGPNVPRLFTDYQVTTGPDGRFVFERVIPGRGRIGRSILLTVSDGATELTSSGMVAASYPSGKTVQIDLGGAGRPVIGKLRRTEGPKKTVPWSFALVNVNPDDSQRRATGLRFTATIDRDGSFHIDDVPAGNYYLGVRFDRPGGGHLEGHLFSVPPSDGKLPQQPVDLGVLTLKPGELQPFLGP